MNITAKLKDSADAIEQRILRLFRDHVNRAFKQSVPAVKKRLQAACDGIIADAPEYQSLINGELMAELGLANPQEKLNAVVGRVKQSIEVAAVPVQIRGSSLIGGMSGYMVREDFEDVLALAEASYVSQPSGERIEWLDWLLKGGDQILVFSHQITYDLSSDQKARSRSGEALMIPGGAGWRVPAEFSGNQQSNFLTRAFDGAEVERLITDIVVSEVESRI
jgi:hypothetical protein